MAAAAWAGCCLCIYSACILSFAGGNSCGPVYSPYRPFTTSWPIRFSILPSLFLASSCNYVSHCPLSWRDHRFPAALEHVLALCRRSG
ncbi:hypothetical protein BCR44DRAFT_46492 [Catenaria anguillulae PL171]|uniref:Secreted protein n=1 Tax=Catenaria anguillulae PL171 TaxID=765915 RepID=A0A1Y2I4W4_9FUNG|nr:hypothetical protein BCR44DRAFT_46492 [Catenaria anguillulae PL171]